MTPQCFDGLRIAARAIANEVRATWVGGSRMDRVLMVAFALFVPYDLIMGNWFDLMVAVIVLVWVWQSVKEETLNG